MKNYLNTLYVTTPRSYLAREGECVVVLQENEVRLRLPIHTLASIVCFGQVSASPALMAHCAEHGVAISFLTEQGRFLARVQGAVCGNVLLRREQYRRADDPAGAAKIARAVLAAKLANSRVVLQRGLRDHPDMLGADNIAHAVLRLGRLFDDLKEDQPLESLRAIEGEAARVYFQVFDHLITAQKEDFFFHSRSRRPPLDNTNALLSFLYTLLAHDVRAALEGVGLDPAVGFLHCDRPGRPGLALDLMEEYRSVLADRLVLSLINRGQVTGKGFRKTESGGVEMDPATRKEVLVAWQKRKQEKIRHPFLGEEMPVGLIFHIQAMLLARYLRGDLDGYPPFFWK